MLFKVNVLCIIVCKFFTIGVHYISNSQLIYNTNRAVIVNAIFATQQVAVAMVTSLVVIQA